MRRLSGPTRIVASALLILASACGDPVSTATDSGGRARASSIARGASVATDRSTDRYVVVFNAAVRNAADAASVTAQLERANGFAANHRYSTALRGFSARLSPAAADALSRHPLVRYLEADAPVTKSGAALSTGTRSLLMEQWGLDRLDQRSLPRDYAYGYESEGEGVEIHIVDTGVRASHPEFGGRVVSLYDWVDGDMNADDCDGHGTHVAGTAAGATVGVARRASIHASRVLGCNGTGTWTAVLAAIDSIAKRKLARPGVPIVGNLSLGSPDLVQSVLDAIAGSSQLGVTWVAAAGNDGIDACRATPAAAPSALTVSASTASDTRATYANVGPCVDLFAPGDGILSSTIDGRFGTSSGTSMAAPHAAGVAALYLAAHPAASPAEVHAALTTGATPGVVRDAGVGSPDRLLYSRLLSSTATVPPSVYMLSTSVAGNGSISATGITCGITGTDCVEAFAAGASVTLTPLAGTASAFGGWTGSCSGTGICTVSMTQARSVAATFTDLPAMHVGDLEAVKSVTSRNWTASVTVLVHDRAEARVSGATVTLALSGGTTGTVTCTTGTTGACTVKGPALSNSRTSLTFTVRSIAKTGAVYLANANHDVTNNSTGHAITVYR